jgi:NAD(P)-dependent dehydrogenase (short-subunit alcohol dehydrogenase family)
MPDQVSTRTPRRWFITGVSSGFGRILAQALLQRGDSVAGTLRKPEQVAAFEAFAPGRAHGLLLDVSQAASIPQVVAEALERLGGVDVLVNNAGYGLFGAVEEIGDDEARQVMETNFFGTLNLTRALLPHFRAQGGGGIVNLSSLAGVLGMPGVGLYCAAKHAIEGLSESLAVELAPFGIRVLIVEPGGFRTDFAGRSMSVASQTLPAYDATPAGKTRSGMAQYSGREPGDPAKAMTTLIAVLESPNPPLRLVLGADAMAAVRGKLARVAADIGAWEQVSAATALTV